MRFLVLVACLFYCSFGLAEAPPAPTRAPKPQTIVFVLDRSGIFEVFLSAIKQAGLEEKLAKQGPFTVLAPRDAAFAHVGSISRDTLFKNKATLKRFVEQHIIEGQMSLEDLSKLERVATLAGTMLQIEQKDPMEIERAVVLKGNLPAENGVIHMMGQAILSEP